MTLWAADPHAYGPGKVHVVDAEDSARTYCGVRLAAIPGKLEAEGRATCKRCLNSVETRAVRERESVLWKREREAEERQREQERQEWWDWYSDYLDSDAWRAKRALVLKRADGICEGCGVRPAEAVHHVTYDHAGDEFLWELRAICHPCHERIHDRGRKP